MKPWLDLLVVAICIPVAIWLIWCKIKDANQRDDERQARRRQIREWRAGNRREMEWQRTLAEEESHEKRD